MYRALLSRVPRLAGGDRVDHRHLVARPDAHSVCAARKVPAVLCMISSTALLRDLLSEFAAGILMYRVIALSAPSSSSHGFLHSSGRSCTIGEPKKRIYLRINSNGRDMFRNSHAAGGILN